MVPKFVLRDFCSYPLEYDSLLNSQIRRGAGAVGPVDAGRQAAHRRGVRSGISRRHDRQRATQNHLEVTARRQVESLKHRSCSCDILVFPSDIMLVNPWQSGVASRYIVRAVVLAGLSVNIASRCCSSLEVEAPSSFAFVYFSSLHFQFSATLITQTVG